MADETEIPTTEGSRARQHWASIGEAVHARIAGKIDDAKQARLAETLERFERELVPHLAPFLAEHADNPNIPEPVRDLIGALTEPEHFTQSLLVGLALGAVLAPVLAAMTAPTGQDIANEVWTHNPNVPLSPAEAALAVLRHTMDPADAAHAALQQGVNQSNFDVLVKNTGDTIGLGQLQEALRRGFIDSARFATGVEQSRVRDEWVDVLLDLKFVPVPIGEVLAGVVQGHLDPADAKVRLGYAGIDPSNFDWLFETHGRPPGVVELGQLVNRGEMDVATWEQAIRESDIKNKYIPFLDLLRRRLMPERTVVSAIRQAVISSAEGVKKLQQLGFSAEDAATLAAEATSTKKATQKELTEAQIVKLYTERLTTEPKAKAMLSALGYSADEITFILSLADHARHMSFQTAQIARVHNLYVRYKKTAAETSGALDKIGLDAAGRDDLLELWGMERAANVQVLSLAQVQGLVHRGRITPAQFVTRCEALGYEVDDAHQLYWLAFPPTQQPGKDPFA